MPAKKDDPTEEDWKDAEEHLHTVENEYLKLLGVPGVNVFFFFNVVLPPIRGRWNTGIRDRKLFDDIMELK